MPCSEIQNFIHSSHHVVHPSWHMQIRPVMLSFTAISLGGFAPFLRLQSTDLDSSLVVGARSLAWLGHPDRLDY